MQVFKITRETKTIMFFLGGLCIIGFTIAFFYYRGVRRSEDPRVEQARYMLVRFDQLMKEKKYAETFSVMDSARQVFERTPGYSRSYEMGIVLNNQASVFIATALYTQVDSLEKQNLLRLAETKTLKCIHHYETWSKAIEPLTEVQLSDSAKHLFLPDDPAFEGLNYQRLVNKRIADLLIAKKEAPRRLSVAYTNLGIIQRHQFQQTQASESYLKALSLWKDNHTALSNLNVLYGKPPKDRSVINKLFPPDRNK